MNKLIVYFSYTNHTREIANRIKEKLNCDILEIKKLCPNSKVKDGLNILYDAGNYRTRKLLTSLDEIDNWINAL